MRWATAVLAGAAIFLAVPTFVLVLAAVANRPGDATFWWVFAVEIVIHGCLIWAAIAAVRRDARAPGTPLEPSVLAISEEEFTIERAGPDRGMDYSWERGEIADVRLCNAAPDRVLLSAKSVLRHALSADHVVRISVERRSGEVDDVMVLSSGRLWADALEPRLRAYLGLSPSTRVFGGPAGGV